jgi:hypothetical protein
MRSRTGCSSRAGGNKFLALANLGDDPRTPFSSGLRSHFPNIYVADDSVPDSGATVRDDMPCPSHSRDTSLEPAVGTSGVLLPDTLGYSNTFARRWGENGPDNLPTGNHATAVDTGDIEIPVRMNQAEGGPREVPLPKGQASDGSDQLRSEAFSLTGSLANMAAHFLLP